jgi:hypothetical protein
MPVPALVRDSWRRCAASGLDPDAAVPVVMVDDDLEDYRSTHPLAPALPVIRRLLVEHAVADDLVVAITDASGRLLWVEGQSGAVRRAERIHFLGGASWDEEHAGTNAPALALALGAPVRIRAEEHWSHQVQAWSCSASPVYDRRSGALLGALDVTGDSRAASGAVLALVRATAAAVEQELLLRDLRATGGIVLGEARSGIDALRVLGSETGTFAGVAGTKRLSLRHAEILLLLANHPEGLSAEELALALAERDLDPVTVRAEVSRLRRVPGLPEVLARPYRLCAPLATDATRVRGLLDRGLVAEAVRAYAGPILPRSQAPGVERLRDELAAEVRAEIVRCHDAPVLRTWAESPWAADDAEVWSAYAQALPAGGARDRVSARVKLLDSRLGV